MVTVVNNTSISHSDGDDFLVAQSCLSQKWILRPTNDRDILFFKQKFSLSDFLAHFFSARGFSDEQIEDYLAPKIKHSMQDPMHLLDMDKGIKILHDQIFKGEKIAIFGDYDVDGATSSALLYHYFSLINMPALRYIPDRISEGYGPSKGAMDYIKAQGASLVISVDCGTTSNEAIEYAKELGLKFIIIDHHKSDNILPKADAIINPNRHDEVSPYTYLAAVGVVFLFLVAMNQYLRKQKYFQENGIDEPALLNFLDLVALGTVCDVVPLKSLNRAFVSQGLKILQQNMRPGFQSLQEVADIQEPLNAGHLGFQIGPRINAGGRVGQSSLGASLLSCHDKVETDKIAQKLNQYNNERRELEKLCIEEAQQILQEKMPQYDNYSMPCLIAASENWHPGVVGIAAGRLKEKFKSPTIIIAVHDGVGKGSARSVEGIDLGSIFIDALNEGLLINGGGHAMAAGLTIKMDDIDDFTLFANKKIQEQIKGKNLAPSLKIDAILSVAAIHAPLLDELKMLEPFGAANASPLILIKNVSIVNARIVGLNHVSCILRDKTKSGLKAIAFQAGDTKVGEKMLKAQYGDEFHMVGRIKENFWQGLTTAQMIIEDMVPSNV